MGTTKPGTNVAYRYTPIPAITTMNLSVLDLFTIGIGPSSSHTVGPMRAARRFAVRLAEAGLLGRVARVQAHLYGSLALTGRGHGSDTAVLLGLEGETPEGVDVDAVAARLAAVRAGGTLRLAGAHRIAFTEKRDLLFHRRESLPGHPNGMRFAAFDAAGGELLACTYFSVGGGFVTDGPAMAPGPARAGPDPDPLSPGSGLAAQPVPAPQPGPALQPNPALQPGPALRFDSVSAPGGPLTTATQGVPGRNVPPYPWTSGEELLAQCRRTGLGVGELTLRNEAAFRPEAETRAGLLRVWAAMRDCVARGCRTGGTLPGRLNVPRRAPGLYRALAGWPAVTPDGPQPPTAGLNVAPATWALDARPPALDAQPPAGDIQSPARGIQPSQPDDRPPTPGHFPASRGELPTSSVPGTPPARQADTSFTAAGPQTSHSPLAFFDDLPGGHVSLTAGPGSAPAIAADALSPPAFSDPLVILDCLSLWAMAVNEENAAGGRVVTAPTNGAAGIVPAVLHYLIYAHGERLAAAQGGVDGAVVRFLLTAGAIGLLYKRNASISGAEVGCQGEVGVACSMAAAALCEALGGTAEQVENAAEIGMEHNLGLTCDPVGGLVQIPCIERNAMGAVKAIHAARLALHGDGRHAVSLDEVIVTMRQTGADMRSKYKETSRGGLAVNVIEC